MLLGVVSLGWEGLIKPAKRRRFGAGSAPERPAGRGLEASGLVKRYDALVAADDVSVGARAAAP